MNKQSMCLAACLALIGVADLARADAVLQSPATNLFPTKITVGVDVRAQVETTILDLEFSPLVNAMDDYVLTVPSPPGAYSVGVDIDRGQGFSPVPIQDRVPPPGAGSGPQATAEVKAWVGNTPLLASLDQLGAGPLTIRVRFLRLLRRYKGQVSFNVGVDRSPLRGANDPAPATSLTAHIRSFRPLTTLFGQGMPAKLTKTSPTEAIFSVAPTLLSGSLRTQITYAEQSSGIHLQFLAHRTPTADPLGGTAGYFLLVVDADTIAPELTPPRTLNLVIDRSGSMQGDKIDQARMAAMAMLANLHPDDRFNLHAFNEDVESWSAAPVLATSTNIGGAKKFVAALDADGSTNLDDAITAGLGVCPSAEQRFDAMVLISDGLPTVGVTDPAQIYKNSLVHNCHESRIFTFSVGQGADVSLMEALARSAHGRNFVLNDAQAQSELATAVKELFEDIHAVRVTDLSVTIAGVQPAQVLPEQPMDLFNGGQVLVVGRYAAPGTSAAAVTGDVNGKPFAKSIAIDAPAVIADSEFIKFVWATEMVGKLLADMARGGDHDQLEQSITQLGLGYRIQTPFTSFATSSGSGSSGSGSSGGGSGSSGSYPGNYSGGGAGDLDLLLFGLLALVPLARRAEPGSHSGVRSGARPWARARRGAGVRSGG